MTVDELREYFYTAGPAWVREQAAQRGPRAVPMVADIAAQLEPFFGGAVVREARLTVAPIANPPFYDELLAQGVDPRDLLYFDQLDAITLGNIIVLGSEASLTPRTLFHECVHVTQYRLLGVDAFARTYVDGWFAGRDRFLGDPEQRYLTNDQRGSRPAPGGRES